MSALSVATEGLYRAFARYPLARRIEGCPHCELGSAERGLHAAPLRALSRADLGVYPFKAMTTFGSVDDFRHFLPRIAELLVNEGAIGAASVETFADKLAYGEIERWPEVERRAVFAWLDAVEETYLGAGLEHVSARALLHARASLGLPRHAFVARWCGAQSLVALEELAAHVEAVAARANRGEAEEARTLAPQAAAIEVALRRALDRGASDPAVARALALLGFPPFLAG